MQEHPPRRHGELRSNERRLRIAADDMPTYVVVRRHVQYIANEGAILVSNYLRRNCHTALLATDVGDLGCSNHAESIRRVMCFGRSLRRFLLCETETPRSRGHSADSRSRDVVVLRASFGEYPFRTILPIPTVVALVARVGAGVGPGHAPRNNHRRRWNYIEQTSEPAADLTLLV